MQKSLTFPLLITEILTSAPYSLKDIYIWQKDVANYFDVRDPLYHSHDLITGESENLYPLIQFRSYLGCAGIFGIQQGADQLNMDFVGGIHEFKDRVTHDVTEMRKYQYSFVMSLTEKPNKYFIQAYSPFDPDSHKSWLALSYQEQVLDLEKRIRGSLLMQLCKGIGWHVPGIINVKVLHFVFYKLIRPDKSLRFLVFDILYTVNLVLPPRIAIGKNVRLGYGVQVLC